MRGKVFQRVQAAEAAQRFDDVFGHRALVETVAALLCDGTQGLAQLRLLDHIAGDRRVAVRQQIARGVGAAAQFLQAVLPVERDAGGDDITFLGGLDRRLQQGVEAELAVIAQDGFPGVDRAGHR